MEKTHIEALSDDDLWHIAGIVTGMNGGSLDSISQHDCVTAIRASFMDPDAGRAYIAAAAPVAVPEGYSLLPNEPTKEMIVDIQEFCDILPPRFKRIYKYIMDYAKK